MCALAASATRIACSTPHPRILPRAFDGTALRHPRCLRSRAPLRPVAVFRFSKSSRSSSRTSCPPPQSPETAQQQLPAEPDRWRTEDDVQRELARIAQCCSDGKGYLQTPADTTALLLHAASTPHLSTQTVLAVAGQAAAWGDELHHRWFDSYTPQEIADTLWSLGRILDPHPSAPDPTPAAAATTARFTARLLRRFSDLAPTGVLVWHPARFSLVARCLEGVCRLCTRRAAARSDYWAGLQLALTDVCWQLNNPDLGAAALGQLADLAEVVCDRLGLGASAAGRQPAAGPTLGGPTAEMQLAALERVKVLQLLRDAAQRAGDRMQQLPADGQALAHMAALLRVLAAVGPTMSDPQRQLPRVAMQVSRLVVSEHEQDRAPSSEEVELLLQVLRSFLQLGYSPGQLLLLTAASRLQRHLPRMPPAQLATTLALLAAHGGAPGSSFLAAARLRACELTAAGGVPAQPLAGICASLAALGARPDDALLLRLLQSLSLRRLQGGGDLEQGGGRGQAASHTGSTGRGHDVGGALDDGGSVAAGVARFEEGGAGVRRSDGGQQQQQQEVAAALALAPLRQALYALEAAGSPGVFREEIELLRERVACGAPAG